MTESAETWIAELSQADLPEIVRVHIASFPSSASTRLGAEAVRRYYEWQFLAPHDAHFLGGWVNGQLEGYCFCGTFRGAFAGFVARNRWFLVWQLFIRPRLWKHEEVRSAIFNAVRRFVQRALPSESAAGSQPQSQRFGILSIAVSPRCRSLGLGTLLMNEAERTARLRGVHVMGLTVNPSNGTAVRFYERLGWVRVSPNGLWSGRMEKTLIPLPGSQQS